MCQYTHLWMVVYLEEFLCKDSTGCIDDHLKPLVLVRNMKKWIFQKALLYSDTSPNTSQFCTKNAVITKASCEFSGTPACLAIQFLIP